MAEKRMLPTPKAIIFDWDNTLVDTWPLIHGALNDTFAEYNMPGWSLERTREQVSKSMRDSFPALFGEQWKEAGERYRQHYRSIHLSRLQPLEGAEALLAEVKARGLYSVVVSNKLGPSLRLEVAHLGWGKYFDTIVGADDAARDKPHADPVLLAFEKSGMVPGADVWFVGDSETDLECAMETGCTAILYGAMARDHAEYSATHFRGFPYHVHVDAHEEIRGMLIPSPCRGEG